MGDAAAAQDAKHTPFIRIGVNFYKAARHEAPTFQSDANFTVPFIQLS